MRHANIRRTFRLFCIGLLVIALAACEWSELIDGDDDGDDDTDNTPPATETNVPGFSVAISADDFDTTEAALDSRLASVTNARLTVDHQANATGTNLRPTTVFLFDPVNRTAPLIAADPRAALDLPPRMLAYRDGDGAVAVAYTNAAYLDARYDLGGAEDGALAGLDDDLATIASDVTGDDPSAGAASGIADGEGIESVASNNDFTTTLNTLIDEIDSRDALTRLNTIDFQARASSVGRALNPSVLVIFGNPDVGTPLIRASQTVGIDLPQKMLVAADDGGDVTVYYNDPAFIADRHDIDSRDDEVDTIATVLCSLAASATGSSDADCGDIDTAPDDIDDSVDDGPDTDDGINTGGVATGTNDSGVASDPATQAEPARDTP